MRKSKSLCREYVDWVRTSTAGNWATWEPGDRVTPGDVGRFDEHKRFRHSTTLQDYGLPFTASPEVPVGPRLYVDSDGFRYSARAAGHAGAGAGQPLGASASIELTSRKAGACSLQMRHTTRAGLQTPSVAEVVAQVAALVRVGKFDVDTVVVIERDVARGGFAIIATGKDQSFRLAGSADGDIGDYLEVAGGELELVRKRTSSKLQLYDFTEERPTGLRGVVRRLRHSTPAFVSTPVFLPPLGVNRYWWGRLLPWRREDRYLVDPDGKRHPLADIEHPLLAAPPLSLAHLPEHSRRYVPGLSPITVDELAAVPDSALVRPILDPEDAGDPEPQDTAAFYASRHAEAASGARVQWTTQDDATGVTLSFGQGAELLSAGFDLTWTPPAPPPPARRRKDPVEEEVAVRQIEAGA